MADDGMKRTFHFSDSLMDVAWIASAAASFEVLVMRGPDSFEAYSRVLMLEDPRSSTDSEADAAYASRQRSILEVERDVVDVLANFSASRDCYALVADNGVSRVAASVVSACAVDLAGRRYLLAEGPIDRVGHWFGDLCLDEADHPSFLWPTDRAWCITSDREVRYVGVACSSAASLALGATSHLAVVAWPPESDGREFMYMR
ncbi:hypothetical protein [Demequina capsici]|uniref:Uncharacterized protein n=1 Tax=Demequina capsici TaxID=3075620 RepID=A0AA96F847_9MICO|nr:hypothetical protein [Demequina sp. OYTSA14]WNM24587.1 hypothetical protein RN606_00105 [Demequina sp. OYTSA14]